MSVLCESTLGRYLAGVSSPSLKLRIDRVAVTTGDMAKTAITQLGTTDWARSKRIAERVPGEVLREGFRSGAITYKTKANLNDPVTEFDLRADRTIVDIVRSSLPDGAVLTEERGTDGTNNFSRHIPHFAVSIAFCDHDRPLMACVHDPIRNETFTAVRGTGACLNDSPIHDALLCYLGDDTDGAE